MAVFWVVAPCSLVEVYQRFRGPRCLHHQGDLALVMEAAPSSHLLASGLNMEAVSFFETLVSTYKFI
jgi:hypothetical protein